MKSTLSAELFPNFREKRVVLTLRFRPILTFDEYSWSASLGPRRTNIVPVILKRVSAFLLKFFLNQPIKSWKVVFYLEKRYDLMPNCLAAT